MRLFLAPKRLKWR